MAKGPIGNAPRDLRDEFVGENVLYKGGEPPKKTRGPKKVTSNTFHSKVTGETSNKRPDRAGHFRSGGFVRGRDGADAGDMKAGFPKGPPNKKLLQDADDMESVVKGGVKKKFASGGIVDPMDPNDPSNAPAGSGDFFPGRKIRIRGPVDPSRRDPEGYLRPNNDPLDQGNLTDPIRNPQPGFKKGGGIRKMQLGGPLTPGYSGRKQFYPFNKGPDEAVKSGAMRSESTENARALDRAGKRMDTRIPGAPTQQEIKDTAEDARTFKQTGDYKKGGKV